MAGISSAVSETTLSDQAVRSRLAGFIAAATGAQAVELEDIRKLEGGAIREHWLLAAALRGGRLAGRHRLVLCTAASTSLALGLDRTAEFAVLTAAHAAGVTVPEPLLLCTDRAVIGRDFYLTRRVSGGAAGDRIVAGELGGDRALLVSRLGQELAALHAIRPPYPGLSALEPAPADAAQARLAQYGRFLATHPEPHPVAEWGLRWLMRHAPPPVAPVLCHGDFRTGNYLADPEGFTALLDWEFAGWSDPGEDIGWFCLKSWRFGAYEREAGGIAERAAFYRAYEAASGTPLDPKRVHYWEVMAALRWLIIALQQRDRFLVGGERSLDLALTGRRPAECELEILLLTEASQQGA